MIKICHLTTVHPRYDTRIFVKQCISLVRSGYDVNLIVADGKGGEENEGVKIHDIGVSRFGRAGRMIRTVMAVYTKALGVKADIYHFHDPELIPIGLLLKLRGKRVIYDVHEDYPEAILSKRYLSPLARRLTARIFKKFEEFASRRFTSIIPATPGIAERFETLNKNIVIVQNFPILDELQTSKPVPWDKRLNAVAYVGGIASLRGAREMMEAIGIVSKETDVHLILAGEFSPQSLEKDISSMEGWKQTEYLGYLSRDKVARLFGRVKAGLVLIHPEPRYQVSYPVKLFEYMSAGIPVIASDFPLWRKIVEGAGCGLLVDPLKPEEIADAVIYLLENPEEAEKMGRNGRKSVLEQYNWGIEEQKLIKLYNQISQSDA